MKSAPDRFVPSSRRAVFLSVSFLIAASLFCGTNRSSAQVNVLTYHNDFARTGQNTNETALTPANVNTNTFGKLFTYPVDGQIFAQPLYVSALAIPGQGTHNVVFVGTMHDSVYALDADSNTGINGGVLWQVSLGVSAATPNNDFGNRYGPYHDIRPEVGIIGTPVIDLASQTLYVDAFTHEGSSYFHRIHTLNITTGAERTNSPVVVAASIAGTGVGSSGGVLPFDPVNNGLQRPALTLAGGILYVLYSGFADSDPYHGWVLGFNAATLQQLTNYIFCTTPNSSTAAYGANAGEGGLWMGGNGLAVDSATNVYFMVANGIFNATNGGGGTEFADSFIRLSTTNGLAVADFFTPYNQSSLATGDTDLGSGGPLLLPDSAGSVAHPHLMVGAGKQGRIYLLDRDNLGHFNPADDSQIVQTVSGLGTVFSTPAYFNKRIYYQAISDRLKMFAITNGALSTNAISQSSGTIGFPGATPSISANGTNNGIVWVLQNTAVSSGSPTGPAILHAYNATNLATELYNSSQVGTRDTAAWAVKTSVPTVANGKVYVGGASALTVYGNGSFIAIPTISPSGGLFTNSVTVSLADATAGTTLYYTLDNSPPTTNSQLYTGAPFILTNTAAVKVIAFKPGFIPSPVVAATFINSASLSFWPGFLKKEFYPGATRTNLEDPTFTNSPTSVLYLTSFETPSGQGNSYAERVSGYFVAPATTNYVFFLCSDDDSDLFLSTDSSPTNKHLIAKETVWSNSREWLTSGGGSVVASKRSDQFTGTTWPGGNTITLTAGNTYYIEGDHHQGSGGDDFAVTYKFAGAPDPVNGTAPALTGSNIATYAYNNTYITVSSQPRDVVAVSSQRATFSVTAASGYLGDPPGVSPPPISYQWQSQPASGGNFSNIPGANTTSYTTQPLALADNGTRFRAVLSTVGTTMDSSAAKVSVVQNTTPPLPVQVVSVNSAGTAVTVAFSKLLDLTSAQVAQNYSFSPGSIAPTNATLDLTGTNVTLYLGTALPQGTSITLSISGVQDLDGNSVLPGTSITFSFAVLGANGFAATVLQDAPLAFWRLNESSGPTAFDSTGVYNGTYASAVSLGLPGPRPPVFVGLEATNSAVEFTNAVSSSYVTVPALNLNTNAVTFTAWLYPIGSQANYSGLLMTRAGSTQAGLGYTTANQLGYTWNGNTTWSFQSGLTIPQNQWSFVALAIAPSQATLYLFNTNSSPAATNAIAHQSEIWDGTAQIGNDASSANGGRTFNGIMDEVAVFNQTLSPARIAAYYQAAILGGVVVTNGSISPSQLRFTSISISQGQVVLQWLGNATLEEATTLTGPWAASASQDKPYVAPVVGAAKFYRLRQ